ncbi:MAG: fibronectin type III domain-containing protein [Chloroflexota bacterium]|nr:fibronectin type III domain-containing protein [Chloroflexota bacterium]
MSWDPVPTSEAETRPTVPGYEIRIDNGSWADIGTGASHSFPSRTLGTTYTIDVRAGVPSGAHSATSAVSTLQANSNNVPGAPGSPSTSELAATSVKLSWSASSGTVTTYEVSKDGADWIDSGSADTEHSFSALKPNTAYTLQVRARNGAAKSSVAGAPAVITLPDAVPGNPGSLVTSAISASGITLSWAAGSGVTDSYEVSTNGSDWTDSGGDTEHVFGSLDANTAYTLRVRAKNRVGTSGAVSAASVKTLPNPPTAPTTSAITTSGITLSWTASEDGAETYEVSKDGGDTWVDAGGTDTTHIFSGLDANTAYTLQVRAKNASGVSSAVSAASVKTLPKPPSAPTTSAISASGITLTWTASEDGAETYEVSSDGGSNWVDAGGTDTTHIFTGLDANTAYTLQVRAKNASGVSSAVSADPVKTLPAGVPGIPGSPTTSAISKTSITLTWTASSGVVDTYEVSSDGGDTWVDAGSDLEHIFSGLTANTAYTLQVRGKNAIGVSAAASAASATTLPSAAPGVPGSPTTSAISANSITLTWTASSGVVDTYEVSSDGGNTWVDAGSDLSHIFSGLTANTAYTLRVRGKNRTGVSAAASADPATTLPAGVPGIPGSPTTSAISKTSITLTWTASSGVVDTYEVSSDGGDTWVDAGSDLEHIFSGLTANTAYTLQVRGKNAIGVSAAASAASATTLPSAAPGAPGSPATSAITANSIKLTWTASSGVVDSYEVSTDGNDWTDAGSDLEHIFSGLDANTAYTLRVRGKNRTGVSAAASADPATTLPAGVPGIPGSPTTSAISKTSITLTWTASSGVVDTYEVSKDGGDNWVDAGSDLEHIFSGLTANTAYTLRVRGKNRTGVSAGASADPATTLPAGVPGIPGSPTTSAITAASITLTWTASSGVVDTYEVSKDGGDNWVDAGSDLEHIFSGLTANTAYTLQVRGKNGSGVSGAASAASATTLPSAAPGAPGSPTTSAVTKTSITLSWTASSGVVDTYEVSKDGTNWIDSGGGDTEHVFSGLTANTAYVLRVRGKNGSGVSAVASAASVKTLPSAVPGIPGSPTTSAVTKTSITLTWTASSGVVDTYEVSKDGGDNWVDAGSDLEHVFSGLTTNTAYTLQVRGKNTNGVSAVASADPATTLPSAAPGDPGSLATSAITASSITLSWAAGSGVTDSYEVSTDGNDWTDAGSDTEHVFSGLDANTAYTLRVRGKNRVGVSSAVSATTVKTLPNPPTAPETSAITASGITLTWTASADGAETYEVSSDGGDNWVDAGGTDTTHSFSGLTANTAYTLQVRAKNASGVSSAASAASVTTLPAAVPGVPSGLATPTITANSIKLTWTASSGVVDTYEVSTDGNSWTDAGSDTEHIFSSLSANTAYTLRVRAKNRAGVSAVASEGPVTTASAVTQPPDPPSELDTRDIDQDSATLVWDKSDGATSYEVQGWVNPNQPESQAEAGIFSTWLNVGDVDSYTFSSLDADTEYTFGIHAMNDIGASANAMITARTLLERGASLDQSNLGRGGLVFDSSEGDEGDDGPESDGESSASAALPTAIVVAQTLNELPDEIVVRYWQLGAQGRRVGATEISDVAVIAQGVVDAIDLWGYVTPGIEVCFRRPGAGLVFLDAGTAPRTKIPWLGYPSNGMTCTVVDRPGTLVLLAGASPSSVLLSGCLVELTEILNFREAPWGAIIQVLPSGIRLTALEYADGWYKVDFYGRQGWIFGETVIPIGNCALPAPVPQPLATEEAAPSSLSDCMVELTAYLNFREEPWGTIIHQLAPGIRLTALEYADDWYKVDFHGRKGWIIEDYVIPIGSC